MTYHEYMSHGGELCPYCRSDMVEFTDYPNYGTGRCAVKCCACKREWKDIIELRGYEGMR